MIKPASIFVRFSDLDVMGHVNNAIYLSYFECARVHYFGSLLGKDWDWRKNGVLLVRNEVDYVKPIFLTDIPQITMYCDHIGSKSFTVSYEIHVNDVLTSTGKSVLVCFDASKSATIEIPIELKKALELLKKE